MTTFNQLNFCPVPANDDGVLGYRVIEYTLKNGVQGSFDTAIMDDGRQLIVDGDGYFKAETDISKMLKG